MGRATVLDALKRFDENFCAQFLGLSKSSKIGPASKPQLSSEQNLEAPIAQSSHDCPLLADEAMFTHTDVNDLRTNLHFVILFILCRICNVKCYNNHVSDNAKVIPMPKPATPIPHPYPFGTPSPEDAIIEILDYGKKEKAD